MMPVSVSIYSGNAAESRALSMTLNAPIRESDQVAKVAEIKR